MPSYLQREHTCNKFRRKLREAAEAAERATAHDDGDSLTGVLMECNYCSEIELPFEGGECRSCGVPQYF